MMKMNFKKFLLLLLIGIFSVAIVSRVNAENEKERPFPGRGKMEAKKEEIKADMQAKFCEKISELAERLEKRFSERKEKVQSRKENRLTNWEEKIQERDEKLADFRDKRDDNLDEHFKKLEERAGTDEQKIEAVSAFKKAVLDAIEVRRGVVDSAIETFREEVKKLHDSRKTAVNSRVETFASAAEAVLEKAKADCASGTNPLSVRNTLRTALGAGKNQFSADKQNMEKAKTQMQTLIQNRKTAIEKAITDFKFSMEKARIELKKAFPKDTE